MPKKKKKDRPIFKGRSHKSFLNQCRLKLVTLDESQDFFLIFLINKLKPTLNFQVYRIKSK